MGNKVYQFLLPSLLVLSVLWLQQGCRKSDFIVDEKIAEYSDYGQGTGTVTWTKEISHLIEGRVFVNDGQILTIEAGTVVRFREGQ